MIAQYCKQCGQVEDMMHTCGEPPVRSSELVPPHAPATSEDAKRKIVDLWLSGETNDALLILTAFKIGLDEGRRVRGNEKS
jgi:hypothetical protein